MKEFNIQLQEDIDNKIDSLVSHYPYIDKLKSTEPRVIWISRVSDMYTNDAKSPVRSNCMSKDRTLINLDNNNDIIINPKYKNIEFNDPTYRKEILDPHFHVSKHLDDKMYSRYDGLIRSQSEKIDIKDSESVDIKSIKLSDKNKRSPKGVSIEIEFNYDYHSEIEICISDNTSSYSVEMIDIITTYLNNNYDISLDITQIKETKFIDIGLIDPIRIKLSIDTNNTEIYKDVGNKCEINNNCVSVTVDITDEESKIIRDLMKNRVKSVIEKPKNSDLIIDKIKIKSNLEIYDIFIKNYYIVDNIEDDIPDI